MQTGNTDDLVGRIKYSVTNKANRRPLAFLTGSGVSFGAVPMSAEIVEIIRKPLDKADREAFDGRLNSALDHAERYQKAFQWLGFRRDDIYRDRVIQIATLRACNTDGIAHADLIEKSTELEADTSRWNLPKGQAAFGRILTGLPTELRGPVLTTNFDPLTEVSVKKAGGSPALFVNAEDTAFWGSFKVQTEPTILHLHGYWRDSRTLSTPEQLELGRPILEASLGRLLETHTVVVVGYGGWNDVVTRILQDLVAQQRIDDLDILWAIHEKEEHMKGMIERYPALAALVKTPGAVRFYTGIDSNVFFPALEKALDEHLVYKESRVVGEHTASMVGWKSISKNLLEDHAELASRSSAETFLDGRMPSWHDTMNPLVALREGSNELHALTKRRVSEIDSSVTLLLGASGEGKTTIGMQFAKLAAFDPNFKADVFFLSGDSVVSDSTIMQLPSGKSHVLIVDDAYRFVPRLQEIVAFLKESNRRRIHFVLISRDTDWNTVGASHFGWQNYVKYRVQPVQGVSRADALSMVRTWEALGEGALGELAQSHDTESRVQALIESSQGAGLSANERTLLGALLSTRYGEGLREHVAQLMSRMQGRLIRSSKLDDSLLDALVLTAIPYAYGILDLDPSVLAKILGLEMPDLIVDVLDPLGTEAAITYSSGRVVVRHEWIASSIIDICLERGYDLDKAVRRLVGTAAKKLVRDGYAPRTGSIAYLAKRITDLPDLAVTAATAAHRAVPGRLTYVTTLSAVLRKAKKPEDARTVNEDALWLITDPQNAEQIRGYFTEWGVVEGNLGSWARNALLAAVALQDAVSLGAINGARLSQGVMCLLLALSRLESEQHDDRLIRGIASLSVVARGVAQRHAKTWLREAERLVDRADGRYPKADQKTIISDQVWEAVCVARDRIADPLPQGVPNLSGKFYRMQNTSVTDQIVR